MFSQEVKSNYQVGWWNVVDGHVYFHTRKCFIATALQTAVWGCSVN